MLFQAKFLLGCCSTRCLQSLSSTCWLWYGLGNGAREARRVSRDVTPHRLSAYSTRLVITARPWIPVCVKPWEWKQHSAPSMYWLRSIVCVVVDSCQMSSLHCYWAHTSSMVVEQRLLHNDLQQCALIHPWRIEMCNLHCETESARGVRVSEAGVEGGAATFVAHVLHKRDCASAWRGVSPIHEPWNSNRPLRETRQWIQGYVTKDGYEWTTANPSEGVIVSPGVANTRQQEDATEMLEEYDDGHAMEWSCVYGSRTSWRIQESGLHATRAGLWRAPVKSWNDPNVDWCGKCAGWSQERMVSNVEPPTARGRAASDLATRRLEGKAGECRTLGSLARSIITWAIQCQWRESQQYYMLVKMFRAQALETVRSSPEGVNAEVWRIQARNTNLALVSDMTWYFDLCWKDDLVNMMSGTWVVRSTRSERRGGHRVSSEVFLANNDPVKNLNKELCGLVRCFQVASKTSPGSRSPEVSSVRQSRVEPRAWRNSTTSTSGDCQRARCCAKRLSIPSWTRRAWKDPNAMQGMQCMWSPVRKDKAMTKRWSPVTVWQLFCCCCVGCCVCCRCVLALCG